MEKSNGYWVDYDGLPEMFPTHMHDPKFWESLGRVVATFGCLEEILGKAIFAFTATKLYNEEEIQAAYEKWLPKLKSALKDPLGGLIDSYGKAVREHPDAKHKSLDELLKKLKYASKIRNIVCHGSWRPPDSNGASMPLFINMQLERCETPIDKEFLDQVQRVSAELICVVMRTVTEMGWQFPGSNMPGKAIMEKSGIERDSGRRD